MTAISAEATPAQQFVVVAFNGVSLGIMSFAFGVFDMALHYGVLPDLDVRVVSGEPAGAITGGGLRCVIPYDLDAIQAADLVIIPNWRDPAESPPEPLLGALRAAHDRGTGWRACAPARSSWPRPGCSMAARPPRTGRWPACWPRCTRRPTSGRTSSTSTTVTS